MKYKFYYKDMSLQGYIYKRCYHRVFCVILVTCDIFFTIYHVKKQTGRLIVLVFQTLGTNLNKTTNLGRPV